MSEDEAWQQLVVFANGAGVVISAEMGTNVVRRTLAKTYQPRKATDDDAAMRQINSCIEVIASIHAQRELCGVPETAAPTPRRQQPNVVQPPWQTDPVDGSTILAKDYSDLNYIRKQIYERSVRFGDVELLKAWAWDGARFQKVIGLLANEFSLEEIGRALLYFQAHGPDPARCVAVFLTKGAGRVRRFQLILVRLGRLCEDVSKYDLFFDSEPDAADFAERLSAWLAGVERTLDADRSRW